MKLKLIALAACSILNTQALLAQNRPVHTMDWYVSNAPFKMPALTEPVIPAKTFNITDYGAIGDGQTLNTAAIEKTIAACVSAGGGTVLIPAGLWLTGPIELKSNINLHADRGALVLFSTDHNLYPMLDGGKVMSPIMGSKLTNVAITGEGVFDGGGDTWRPLKKTKAAPTLWNDLVKSGGAVSKDGSMYWPSQAGMDGEDYLKKLKKNKNATAADYLPARDFLRPVMVSIQNIKNVMIDGPTFKNSPQFVLNPKFCTNMIIRNVTINNEYYAQNGDGIDLSACKNAIVYHCTVNAGDDGICMKSSGNKDPNTAGLENVVIADNIVYHAHGGFVIGSNTDGGMNNVYVTNCDFVNTDIGIRVKSNRGRGGLVKNIFIDHIYMHDILNEAILLSTYYEDSAADHTANLPADDLTPRFQDFHISDIYCNSAKIAISIIGLPEMPVSRIYFNNMVISAKQAAKFTEADQIELKNVKIISPDQNVYTLDNSRNINITNGSFAGGANTLINANGAKTQNVTVAATNTSGLKEAVKIGNGAVKGAVVIK
jgi:polygalacturonase